MKKDMMNAWVVCLSAAGFFCFEFFQINMFNALDPELIRTFKTNGTTLSLLSALYFYGNVILLIPAGILLDNLSTRKLILVAMSISLIGTTIFALSPSLLIAGIGRFLVGISGGPFCLLSTIRLASRWFPKDKMAFVSGIIVALGMVGGIISQAPFTYLVEVLGWRMAMAVDIIVGCVILFIIYHFVSDYPVNQQHKYTQQRKNYQQLGFVKGLKIVLHETQNWLCGIFASLLNLPIFLLGALWGNLYLIQVFNLTRIQAATTTSMLYIGMLVGAPSFGWIADNINHRKLPIFSGIILCLVSLSYLIYADNLSLTALILLFLFIGFGSSAQVLNYPIVTESNPLSLTGSATGLAAVLIMSGGAIFQPAFGWILDMSWDGSLIDEIPLYSQSSYNNGIWMIIICLVISLLAVIILKDPKTTAADEPEHRAKALVFQSK